jgi:hypothetical protein
MSPPPWPRDCLQQSAHCSVTPCIATLLPGGLAGDGRFRDPLGHGAVIVAAGLVFAWVLTIAQVPQQLVAFVYVH